MKQVIFTTLGIIIWAEGLVTIGLLGRLGLDYLDSGLSGDFVKWSHLKITFIAFLFSVIWGLISFFLGYYLIFG